MLILPSHSAFAAHVLAALFALLAIIGTILIAAHHRARRGLFLAGEPGTIASAVSIAGGSELAYLIEAKDDPELMAKLLRNHRFGLDESESFPLLPFHRAELLTAETGRIIIDGEVISTSPRKRRLSNLFSKSDTGDAEIEQVLRERRTRHSMSSRIIPE